MRHAEALFLVDDDQTKVLETGLLRQDGMGPDHDVHVAGGQLFAGLLHLLGGNEP